MTREVVYFGPTEAQMAAMDRLAKNPLSRELTCTGEYISISIRTANAEVAPFLLIHGFRRELARKDGFEYLGRGYVPRDEWEALADVVDAASVVGKIR